MSFPAIILQSSRGFLKIFLVSLFLYPISRLILLPLPKLFEQFTRN